MPTALTDIPKLPRVKADDENMEKVHCAARKGQVEELQRLIGQGVDPFIPNKFGCTALHLACKFNQVATVKFLAALDNVPTNPWHGQKPMHLAVLSNNADVLGALIEGMRSNGGRQVESFINECDENEVEEIGVHRKHCEGQTALHWCVGLGSEYLPMIELLVKLGASPTAKDKAGETPLMRAMEFNFDEAFDLMLQTVPSKKSLRLDYVDKVGSSHLHWAIRLQQEAHAQTFIDLGHDIDMINEEKMTPLYLAVRAAMPTLTATLLQRCDPFLIQQAPFHNGSTVIADRIVWLSNSSEESARSEVISLFQKRMDELNVPVAKEEEDGKEKRKKKQTTMELAPSAPIRQRNAPTRKSKAHA